MIVTIYLKYKFRPVVLTDVQDYYEKGAFICFKLSDGNTTEMYPIDKVNRVTKVDSSIQQVSHERGQ